MDLQLGTVFNQDSPSGHVPDRAILFDDVVIVGLSEGCPDHFEQSHQKNDSIFEVFSMDVSQIELRNVSKTLDREYPQ